MKFDIWSVFTCMNNFLREADFEIHGASNKLHKRNNVEIKTFLVEHACLADWHGLMVIISLESYFWNYLDNLAPPRIGLELIYEGWQAKVLHESWPDMEHEAKALNHSLLSKFKQLKVNESWRWNACESCADSYQLSSLFYQGTEYLHTEVSLQVNI
jgi:hypothetical protein